MLMKYACSVPNEVAYPLFKQNLVACWNSQDPMARVAGLKVIGFVSDNDAISDPIKDDVDELTDLLV